MESEDKALLRLALPKGRMKEGVFKLLSDAGIRIQTGGRAYRPSVTLDGVEAKILKPQNIVEMLAIGSRDLGFAGADWVAELDANVVELLDTGLDPVRIVAATVKDTLENNQLPKKPLIIASEYKRLTAQWIQKQQLDATFIRSFGATEVFPPEDADCIVDCTATGATLRANELEIVANLMHSSTRLYAYPKTLENPQKKEAIETFVLLLKSVLEARSRVIIEVNVSNEQLEAVTKILPCMRQPTISPLQGDAGYAVKAAVVRKLLPSLIPKIKELGGTDIIVSELAQIVP